MTTNTASNNVCVLALDAGTTGVRARAVFTDGRAPVSSYREFTQYFPQPGWVEHDALEIWQAAKETINDVLSRLDALPVAIGITNQRETTVAWSRSTGAPLHRAIVWQDRRTAERCDQLEADGALPLVRQRTGLVLDPYFSGTKFEWMLTHGGVEANADLALGTIDSWLLFNLTGGRVHATDPSNASRTMLFDIGKLAWDPDMCTLLNVPMHALAEVLPSSGRFGVTTEDSGVPAGIPISG
ncbi:MAG: glycerol kinase, partial [Actinobacteria bacterium]|nr:glycerol kinase [Actinomycetota bacterium]